MAGKFRASLPIKQRERLEETVGRRRKRRIKKWLSATYCLLGLALTVLLFRGMETLFHGHLAPALEKLPVIEGTIAVLEDEEIPLEEDKLTVCIDPGHGGKDNGSNHLLRYEKNDNLKIAMAVASYLADKDVQVIMTRNDDTFLSLAERTSFANENEADYLVSLHRNTGDGNGVETWINSTAGEETKTLADNIMKGLEEVGIQRNRGVKVGTQKSSSTDYYINLHAKMPSCIVELGFMNSTEDNKLFDEHLTAYAKAIGDAVLAAYEVYGETGGDGTETLENTEDTEQGQAAVSRGQILNLPVIENIESLDSQSQNWGQGVNMDEKNRPVAALSAQEKYGKYNAYFIGEESQNIYLTFDEGYEYGQTESILNTLKEKGVKAIFFVTKPYAESEPELVNRMIDEGHIVGNHSVTHPSKGLPSQTLEQQKEEVVGNHNYVKENFDYDMYLFRYPTGCFSEQSLALLNNCNYKSVFWSFAYVDYDVSNQPDPAESLAKLKQKLHPGAIYLLHAESETNAAILGDFIDAVREAGYEFEVL